MKNCFVKKYKGVVNDDSLLKYGEVRIPVVNGTLNSMAIVTGSASQVVKGVGDVKLNGSSSITCNAGWTNNIAITGVPNGSIGYISIPDKYNLLAINGQDAVLAEGDLYEMFGIMPACVQYRVDKDSAYPLSSLAKAFPILEVVMLGNNMTGALSDLFPIKDTVTSFETAGTSGEYKITGTFDDLGHFYKINNWKMIASIVLLLSGTVEGFVANRLIEQPATAGSVSVNWLGSGGRITYQGEAITDKQNNTIAWDAQGNITLS